MMKRMGETEKNRGERKTEERRESCEEIERSGEGRGRKVRDGSSQIEIPTPPPPCGESWNNLQDHWASPLGVP
jgi:hypothetical protein